MTKLAVAYHSGFGHTKVVAECVVKGINSVEGCEGVLIDIESLPAPDANHQLGGDWDVLNAADGIIFGCPTYMGCVSATFKKFMEDSSAVWFTQGWRDKIAAGFTNAGGTSGDKLNTLVDMAVFAGQHSMVWVSQGLFYGDQKTDAAEDNINRMGSWIGMMAQSENASPEVTPPASDRLTAERFGARVGEYATRVRS